jgi:hypothetical protein
VKSEGFSLTLPLERSLHTGAPMHLRTLGLRSAVCVSMTLAVAAGCGDDEANTSATNGAGASTGAGGDGGAGAGGACPEGTHAGEVGACESTIASWTAAAGLGIARDHHVTFVVQAEAGAFLHGAGGGKDNVDVFADSEIAPIAEDGSLGAWTSGADLPEPMAGAGVAIVGDTLILTGGYRLAGAQPFLSRGTEVAPITPAGTIGAFIAGPDMIVTRFHHAMVSNGEDIYVIGGLTGDNTDNTPSVQRARVSGGEVSFWSDVTPLPRKLSHHSATVHDGAIYLTGGLTGNPSGVYESFTEVLRAEIQGDGSLGEWEHAGDLPVSLTTHASFVHAGGLFVVGGIEDGHMNTAAVRRASIAPDGTVGAFVDLPALPKARAHCHHSPLHGAFVYAAGGALNHVSMTDVFIGRLE